MTENLKSKKTTFQLLGSSNRQLNEIQDEIKTKHYKHVTRTDLLNIAVSEFLTNIETPEDIITYLLKYNKV